jgi:hypothetical protein
MGSDTAAASLGALSGAWAYPLHGAEIDSIKIKSNIIKAMGVTGMMSSFIFIILFAAMFIKITEAPVKNTADVKTDNDIDESKLSPDVKTVWRHMKYLVIFGMLFGFLTMLITSLINEGFVDSSKSAGALLLKSTFVFGLGGTAITLAFVIGMLIVQWPNTVNPETGKSKEELIEDNKLYRIVKANKVYGVAMSIMFLLPVITIMGTEFDENRSALRALERDL